MIAANELMITRVFQAPRALVWQAWTSPEHVAQWWGPRGFSARIERLELRTGGTWRYIMIAPDGAEHAVSGTFREVVPQATLVTTTEFDPGFEMPGVERLPQGMVLTATFDDLGDKTRLTLRIAHATPEDRHLHEELGVVAGWTSSLDRLDELTAGQFDAQVAGRMIIISRRIRAPRELVFATFTDRKHISNWWGPNGFRTTTDVMDVRPGGVWRFVMHGPDGRDYENLITYLEVEKPEQLVYKHGGEGETADVQFHTTVTFAEDGGDTLVTLRSLFPSSAVRDRVVREFGAIEGGEQTLARLAAQVETSRSNS